MEQKRSNKGLIALVVIMGLIIAGLVVILVLNNKSSDNYDKDSVTSENEVATDTDDNLEENNVTTYSDIKGVYSFSMDANIEGMPGAKAKYNLYLWENGTFNYQFTVDSPQGLIGNYIIVDNTIVLNYMFATNSGAGINYTEGTKTLNINQNGTITDSTNPLSNISTAEINLTKTSDLLNSYNQYSVSYILNNYEVE